MEDQRKPMSKLEITKIILEMAAYTATILSVIHQLLKG